MTKIHKREKDRHNIGHSQCCAHSAIGLRPTKPSHIRISIQNAVCAANVGHKKEEKIRHGPFRPELAVMLKNFGKQQGGEKNNNPKRHRIP
jgi:hypothetical protein